MVLDHFLSLSLRTDALRLSADCCRDAPAIAGRERTARLFPGFVLSVPSARQTGLSADRIITTVLAQCPSLRGTMCGIDRATPNSFFFPMFPHAARRRSDVPVPDLKPCFGRER
jgi:hypothetical protein